eukprot:13899534-Alexandrium_andersonii.AAC.1
MASSFPNRAGAVLGKGAPPPMSLYGCAVTPLPKAEVSEFQPLLLTQGLLAPGALRSAWGLPALRTPTPRDM